LQRGAFGIGAIHAHYRWTDDGNSILDYIAAVADFAVARVGYRAASRRWPEAKITLRQGARVVERNWSTSEAAN
jgi:hypothetical protein